MGILIDKMSKSTPNSTCFYRLGITCWIYLNGRSLSADDNGYADGHDNDDDDHDEGGEGGVAGNAEPINDHSPSPGNSTSRDNINDSGMTTSGMIL